MYNEKFVSAVIVAAGASARMKSGTSKQMLPLMGKTVLYHCVSVFAKMEIIDEIVVVCPEKSIEEFSENLKELESLKSLKYIAGGVTRQKSVFNGVSMTDSRSQLVAVHDGARPLLSAEYVAAVIKDACLYSVSTLAVPVKDTIKTVDCIGTVTSTPNREQLRIIQTPQVFDKNLYLDAYKKAEACGKDFTDDCQLIEFLGKKVHTTLGDYSNIKITTPDDICLAEAFLKMRGER